MNFHIIILRLISNHLSTVLVGLDNGAILCVSGSDKSNLAFIVFSIYIVMSELQYTAVLDINSLVCNEGEKCKE